MLLETDIRAITTSNYFILVSIAFLYYDHLLTLPREISYIWSRPLAKYSIWFFLNRYIAFAGQLVVALLIITGSNVSEKRCQSYILLQSLLLWFNQAVVAVLLALRTYALHGASRRVLVLLCPLVITSCSLCLWNSITANSIIIPGELVHGCQSRLTFETSVHIAISWESQIVLDVTILVLTLAKSYQHWSDIRLIPTADGIGLMDLFARDGIVFFGVIVLVNAANVATFYLSSDILRGSLSTFSTCVSVTMMSRLMLNLHDAASVTPSTHPTMKTVAFAPMHDTVVPATPTADVAEMQRGLADIESARLCEEIQEVSRTHFGALLQEDEEVHGPE